MIKSNLYPFLNSCNTFFYVLHKKNNKVLRLMTRWLLYRVDQKFQTVNICTVRLNTQHDFSTSNIYDDLCANFYFENRLYLSFIFDDMSHITYLFKFHYKWFAICVQFEYAKRSDNLIANFRWICKMFFENRVKWILWYTNNVTNM